MTEIKSAALELGTERIRKLLVQYAVPAIIAMTASSLYNMVDSIFIGHGVGPLAISGLALTFPLMNLAAAFGSLVGVGAATLISMRLGQRDYETAQRVLGNVLVLNLIIGIAFGLVPSAMWPSVPKIIPMKLLGTAYALIFYIQNIGLALVPVWIGKVNQANTAADGTIDYTQTMTIFAGFGVIAIVIALLLLMEDKRKGYGLQKPNIK